MMDFMDGLLHISPWSSWCLDVFECESRDSVCFLFERVGGGREGGRAVGGFLLADSESALEIGARGDGRGSFWCKELGCWPCFP